MQIKHPVLMQINIACMTINLVMAAVVGDPIGYMMAAWCAAGAYWCIDGKWRRNG